ncbi:MAG: primase C-terminal domain-containing protein [Amoebophilaceae bacterium]|nr:primase C-terminal domain-containing protein [Amoebophilaceae bacterium]MBY0244585.1 primase C-terminal domain-containing protein [Sphingobacteriaceae bacterium]
MTNLEVLALLHQKPNNLIDVFRERKFHSPHSVNINWRCIEKYQHIKQSQRSYLMFDIDKIDIEKVKLLFRNKFFTPNFYIYEYSKKKQCYTLQVFILLDTYKITENFIKKYKKFCLIFGADLAYSLKTGIHKNPAFAGYENITLDEQNLKIINKNHVGYIHSKVENFADLFEKFARAKYFENLLSSDGDLTNLDSANDATNQQDVASKNKNLTIKIKAISEVKTTNAAKKSSKEIGTRNINLFNKTREIAYSMTDKSLKTILHIAKKINAEFTTPLKDSEVKKTAQSIYKFISEKFNKNKVDPYSDFQRLRSIEVRKKSAISKIEMAILLLKRQNKNLSLSAIKKISHQNLQTIRNNFNSALLAAENYEKSIIQLEKKQEKRSQNEFKNLVSVVFNQPIRARKRRRKILVKPAPAAQVENLKINTYVRQIADLMPNFDTSCDFIFNNK